MICSALTPRRESSSRSREAPKRAARWAAVEALRAKFGEAAVLRGRGLKK